MSQAQKSKKNKKRKTRPLLQSTHSTKVSKVQDDVKEEYNGPIVTFTSLKRKIGAEVKIKEVKSLSDSKTGAFGPKIQGADIIEKETTNSQSKAKELLNWMLWPLPVDQFYEQQFERFCCSINRILPDFFNDWVDLESVFGVFNEKALKMDEDVVISSETPIDADTDLNDVIARKLFDSTSCKVRLNGFHRHSHRIAALVCCLEEFFTCPFDSFVDLYAKETEDAPFQESADLLVIQFEGSTEWRIYNMEFPDENLSRHESHVVDEEEAGTPGMVTHLKKGDIMYIPKGTIFKSLTSEEASGVLVLSFSQFNGWVDFIESVVTKSLTKAVLSDVEFRRSLPRDYHEHMGLVHTQNESERRKELLDRVTTLCSSLLEKYIPGCIDVGADDMMCQFMKFRKSPQLLLSSKETGAEEEPHDNDPKDDEKQFDCNEKTRIKLLSRSIVRFTEDEDCYLHYSQSYVGDEDDPSLASFNSIEVPATYRDAIMHLNSVYPKYIAVKELPFETPDEKIDFTMFLAEREILLIE